MGSSDRATSPKLYASGSSAHELCSSSERERHDFRAETLSHAAPVRWTPGPRCRCSRPLPVPRAAPLLGFLRPFSAISSVSPFRRRAPRGLPPQRRLLSKLPLTPCLQGGREFASPATVSASRVSHPPGGLLLTEPCRSVSPVKRSWGSVPCLPPTAPGGARRCKQHPGRFTISPALRFRVD